jgi:hypothetical protein
LRDRGAPASDRQLLRGAPVARKRTDARPLKRWPPGPRGSGGPVPAGTPPGGPIPPPP